MTMTNIKFRRGPQSSLPTLEAGEPAFCTDTKKFFIGDGLSNYEIGGSGGSSSTYTFTRTTPTALNNYIEIGYISGASVLATVAVNGTGGNTIGSKFFSLCSYSGTTTGWAEVIPLLNSGVSNSNDFTIDANWDQTNTKLELRIRLSNYGAVISGSLNVRVDVYAGTFAQTSTSGATIAPANFYDTSIITQYNDMIGIGTDNPTELLDVNGAIRAIRIRFNNSLLDATLPTINSIGTSIDYNDDSSFGHATKIHFQDNQDRAIQLAGEDSGSNFWLRSGTETTWESWVEIVHTGNMNTIGINADTLDNLNSLQFIRNDQDETTNGNLTFSKTAPKIILNNNSTSTSTGIEIKTGNYLRWEIIGSDDNETGSDAGTNFEINRYDDSGSLLGNSISIDRVSGDITLSGDVGVNPSNTFSVKEIIITDSSGVGKYRIFYNSGTDSLDTEPIA